MARMHSRKKGMANSVKPSKEAIPTWVSYKAKEVEHLIVKYAKESLTTSEIGIRLRDTYGIPSVKAITKKSIGTILKERNIVKELPEDLLALVKKASLVNKHLENNRHDKPAMRGLQLTESKIKRLVRYYKSKKRLPLEWKYDRKNLAMYAE
jgi:small subunit ribosomal protein S15